MKMSLKNRTLNCCDPEAEANGMEVPRNSTGSKLSCHFGNDSYANLQAHTHTQTHPHTHTSESLRYTDTGNNQSISQSSTPCIFFFFLQVTYHSLLHFCIVWLALELQRQRLPL